MSPRLRFFHGLSQPVWFTVLHPIQGPDGTPYLLVRRRHDRGKPWRAPYVPVPAGITMRGWVASPDSPGFPVIWDAPQASGRLVTDFLTHAYPAAIVHRLVRQPGVATFIQLHTMTAAQRSLCYSPLLRERLQALFYQSMPPAVRIPEVFRLTADALPLASQAAHLLGLAPHHVTEISDHVLQITRATIRHPAWVPLVAQCLGVHLWTPASSRKTRPQG